MSTEKNLILFDDQFRTHLLPFTFTRPVSEIRLGILTLNEKWQNYTHLSTGCLTTDYLQKKFPHRLKDENIYINASILPNRELAGEILKLTEGHSLITGDVIIAVHAGNRKLSLMDIQSGKYEKVHSNAKIIQIRNTWDIFVHNGHELMADFELITDGRTSQVLSQTNNLINPDNIFVESGIKAEYVTINATAGKVYIGKDAEIMEGAIIRGPVALCNDSTIKMGAKIYGNTTIGPFSKVGGEIHSTIIFGYSNKAHDGFLGNSVIGEWCNIGADSNNSNLKNNYAQVKLWDYAEEKFVDTGLQFCGLMMGDHSKCGINTMFNTGTVIGISANLFGSGFPRNFIPSFAWGGATGYSVYNYNKAAETAKLVYERRNLDFTEDDKMIFKHIFEMTAKYRKF